MTFRTTLALSTALSTAFVIAAGAAAAAEKPKLRISGYQETYIGMSFDRDGKTGTGTPTYSTGGDGSFGIYQYGEIRFTATGTTDSGLKWGVRFEDVQDDADTAGKKDSTDEAHMWVEGSWGRLEIGGQDGPADTFRAATDEMLPIDRRIGGVWTDTQGTRLRGAEEYNAINDSSDDTKLTYYSPRFSGLRVGYSYVPHAGARGSVGTNNREHHEFGLEYKNKVGGGDLLAALSGSLENGAAPDGDDLVTWMSGITFSHSGWSVALGLADYGELRAANAGEEGSSWDIGVSYEQGPWMVGIAHYSAEHEVNGAADDEYSQTTLFGAYNLGGGLSVAGGLLFVDLEDSSTIAGRDNKATVAVFKVGAAF